MRADLLSRWDSEAAKIMGNMGAKLGGYARAESLTPKQRSKSASVAAKSRWNTFRKEKQHELARTSGNV